MHSTIRNRDHTEVRLISSFDNFPRSLIFYFSSIWVVILTTCKLDSMIFLFTGIVNGDLNRTEHLKHASFFAERTQHSSADITETILVAVIFGIWSKVFSNRTQFFWHKKPKTRTLRLSRPSTGTLVSINHFFE